MASVLNRLYNQITRPLPNDLYQKVMNHVIFDGLNKELFSFVMKHYMKQYVDNYINKFVHNKILTVYKIFTLSSKSKCTYRVGIVALQHNEMFNALTIEGAMISLALTELMIQFKQNISHNGYFDNMCDKMIDILQSSEWLNQFGYCDLNTAKQLINIIMICTSFEEEDDVFAKNAFDNFMYVITQSLYMERMVEHMDLILTLQMHFNNDCVIELRRKQLLKSYPDGILEMKHSPKILRYLNCTCVDLIQKFLGYENSF